ncbi:MAG: thiamine pyrophosphate-binding protein [Bryobacteraceae bacterium]|nr:thiamine pyrophosphate-binding protein [Bryobacteraceae bacterium]
MQHTAVEWFVKRLHERGVDFIATLCGFGLDPLYDAAKWEGLRLVDTRNEQTASYVAECFGRLTRRPGVCAVSSGVAHVNALTGVLNAHFDGAPMLLISGAGPLRTRGMGHFQDYNQVAAAAPITCYSRVIDSPERVVHILDQALDAAVSTPGPVHLTFPLDVQAVAVRQEDLIRGAPAPAVSRAQDDAAAVAEALASAKRPLVVAGSGVFYAGESEEMLAFADKHALPVVAPIWDRGAVERVSETFMGVLGAATGGPRLLADADLTLMAGAANDYRVGFLQPDAIRADARVFFRERDWRGLDEAYAKAGGKRHSEWLAEAGRRNAEFRREVARRGAKQAEQGMHASHIVAALQAVMTDETVLLIDGGSVGQWAHQSLCDRYPGHWLTCGRSGVVGYGIGGAMAARLAFPDRPVILLSGDGAFTFNVADLECAARQKLTFVAVVADDQGWGITRIGHIEKYGEAMSSSLGPIAIDRLAEALGARGVRVGAPEEIEPALRVALAHRGVTVIQVPIVGGNPGA